MQVFAETDRLILRALLPEDVEGMFRLDSDPDVHRYLGKQPVQNIHQSGDMIANIRQQYSDFGIARWAVIEKGTGEFVGWSGLKLVTEARNNHTNFYDIGYRLIKDYWGKGYATESALAALTYGFNVLNLPIIYGMADIENVASNKVLQKIGLQFVETFDLDGTLHNWYELKK
jgi:RimJ/RimL family protein N-acetyltransferase